MLGFEENMMIEELEGYLLLAMERNAVITPSP